MDAESFKKKFLPYHRKLYRVAYRLLENSADAEDIVQEAYLKLWDKREGLTVISNPEAFSVTLVKNMCFDLLRSGKYILSRQTVELSAVQDISQSDNLEVREGARQVTDIIAHLPEQQQRIINMRDIKGCSYEEIEQVTGLNSINVRVLLSRARKKIREEFNKWNNYESRRN
ncbi:RNA polymerase sigma factor [Bacteroides hominis]|uniref:RNA polymerase sigma factor n=1 Tax=Bacteroides hominis TaxID=2763023 RepID=UPI0039C1E150